ncbi:tetratricopeptide repeat-containing sulfotransferase family protein [Limobrevibacterium gyesilva]|uniref:Sulfotransferase n=1 Tax=Limobrevibacterium gyesilva TaxID=2991712 RepID=A0AA41YM21_9PROT|nr:tetratricopeptide repeat-containing sulfotransferase family protein [Limobrevibacterium gyesilva]MCW3474802.1 sulfotransferase [Limobrevibacterium gyesilva]
MNDSAPALCACGSGLRPASCCRMDAAKLLPPDATRHLVPLIERAIQAYHTGAIAAAERLCIEVLESAPDRVGALRVLYDIRKAQGQSRAAEALIRRVVALDPNDLAATNELALILLSRGDLAEAELHARNAVRIAPESGQAHNLMGMILTEAQRPAVGEYHYRRVLELSEGRDPILLANLAWNLKTQGRMQEARALYKESVAAAPAIRQTLLGWARLEEADRDFTAASDVLDRMERLFPDDAGVRISRAVLLGRMRRYPEALAVLDAMAARSQNGMLGPDELLEKGRLLDQMGHFEDAFAAFTEGKRLARALSGNQYLDQQAGQLIDRLRGFFTAGRLRLLPRATVRTDVPQPVFILGFPRSGTTLVEQTVSAHSRICAGDELPLINDIANLMPRMLGSPLNYPEALSELWMGDQRDGLDNLRDHYLQKVRQMGVFSPGADWFTDKMPLNEMHLGLIALIFPQAPLIHVVRHPLDIMVSAMSNHFTHGFYCAYALETAATHYLRVMELVQHYRAEMALRYLPIRYEDMIDDQEGSVRTLLAFIGAEFEPGCLSFHENRRYARTASYAQVTEKLYDRSRFRYRHYLKHLAPVIPILQPVIERLGYGIDGDGG